jgi:hypothetical protein
MQSNIDGRDITRKAASGEQAIVIGVSQDWRLQLRL